MATSLRLIRGDDIVAGASPLVLTDDTDGFSVRSWQTATPGPEDDRVIEQFTMTVTGSSHDAIAANVQKLDLKERQVEEFKTGVDKFGIWLEAKAANETNTRQALVTGMQHSMSGPYGVAFDQSNKIIDFGLAIERTPFWELDSTLSSYAIPAATSKLKFLGGSGNYGSIRSVPGDVSARMALLILTGASTTSNNISEVWAGFRSDRFGSASNFKSLWELELGSASNNTATSTAEDGTSNPASGTTPKMMRCTFGAGDTTMQKRVSIRTDQAVSSNRADQRGQFHVLLRAKKTISGDTIHVRLLDGFDQSAAFRTSERVEITKTVWYLYNLGSVQIPSPGRQVQAIDTFDRYSLIVHAQRASGGTGNLDLDCLCLVPYGEGLVYVSNASVQVASGSTTKTFVQNTADGIVQATATLGGASGPTHGVQAHITGGVPIGRGVIFTFGQSTTEQHINDECTLTFFAAHRWLTLRGNQ